MLDPLDHDFFDEGARPTIVRDFDFESKPWWFWYEKPTAIITAVSYMDIVGRDIVHDTLRTELAPLASRDAYIDWLWHIRGVLTEPDALTGHNIDRFDLPLFNAQLLRQGLPTLPSLLTHDTLTALPKRRDVSASQESLLGYYGLKPFCPIGMPIYKDHLSIPAWEDAALGWNDADLRERPMSDVHGHAHLRASLLERGYIRGMKRWSPRRAS